MRVNAFGLAAGRKLCAKMRLTGIGGGTITLKFFNVRPATTLKGAHWLKS